ncbi:hypothetical protein MRX96_049495 [Rhipicephalus microplus]
MPEWLVLRHRFPQRPLDTADEFQSSSPTTDAQRRGRPRFRVRSVALLRIQVPWCLQGMFRLALQVDRTCLGKFLFSASLHLEAGARFVGADQVPLPHADHLQQQEADALLG